MNLSEYLARQNIPFQRIRHAPSYDAQQMASTIDLPGRQVAKTVLLRTDCAEANYVVAVIPGDARLDFDKLSRVLGAKVELATSVEMGWRFPDCELGAAPPFGSAYNMRTVVDTSLSENDEIAFEGTSHIESIRMAYAHYESLEHPLVAAITHVGPHQGESDQESGVRSTTPRSLIHEFQTDQQQMIRLLYQVVLALDEGELKRAKQLANQLNRIAGPHIAYEETEVYPRHVARCKDDDEVQRWREEHRLAALALAKLIRCDVLDGDDEREVCESLGVCIDHSEQCGRLVSLLSELPTDEQQESLKKLIRLRREVTSWTEYDRERPN